MRVPVSEVPLYLCPQNLWFGQPRNPSSVRLNLGSSFLGSQQGLEYRGTSLTRKRTPLGPYREPMPRVLGGSLGGWSFLTGEVPLHRLNIHLRFNEFEDEPNFTRTELEANLAHKKKKPVQGPPCTMSSTVFGVRCRNWARPTLGPHRRVGVQGYFAHTKPPPPLGPP